MGLFRGGVGLQTGVTPAPPSTLRPSSHHQPAVDLVLPCPPTIFGHPVPKRFDASDIQAIMAYIVMFCGTSIFVRQ
jgi:hypothetical protein